MTIWTIFAIDVVFPANWESLVDSKKGCGSDYMQYWHTTIGLPLNFYDCVFLELEIIEERPIKKLPVTKSAMMPMPTATES